MTVECLIKLVKDFGIFFTMLFTVIWYNYTKRKEKANQRKSLATAILAEIEAVDKLYKKVELKEWDKWEFNNIQNLQENYMVTYNQLSDRISLFSLNDVTEIVTFYTHLKAHIDTLRVLAKEEATYNYLNAGVNIFGNIGNSSQVLSDCLESFKSTHGYALTSQEELYDNMERVKYILGQYLKLSWCERLKLYLKNMFNSNLRLIKDDVKRMGINNPK